MKERYTELDLLRTVAVVMMIIYHAAYDLEVFYGWNIGIFEETGWYVLRQTTASLFLLLVGCSFAISWNRTPKYWKYLKRGIGVIGCGMLVSAVTFMMDPETYVRFGILHMIGVSILLLPFFAQLKEATVFPGILFLIIAEETGEAAQSLTPVLLPLGIMPAGFTSVDYFPLIPWFGIVLIGYAAGHFLYVRQRGFRKSSSDSSDSSHTRHPPTSARDRALAWPGRHALVIYLLHQPIIFGILGIFGFFDIL